MTSYEDRWEFDYRQEASCWRWLRIDMKAKGIACSECTFATLDECVENAKEHGYAGPVHESLTVGIPR